jgi:hypothetical protein
MDQKIRDVLADTSMPLLQKALQEDKSFCINVTETQKKYWNRTTVSSANSLCDVDETKGNNSHQSFVNLWSFQWKF